MLNRQMKNWGKRTADAAANMARFDEQLVQVQRTWRIAGRERDDAGNLPVGRGRDPHIAGSDVLSGDPEGGKHQCHEFGVVAPYRLRAETQIRQRGRLLDPGRPDVKCRVHQR